MKIPFKKELPIILASSLIMASPLSAKTAEESNMPAITIYQGGIALVTESREFSLSDSQSQLFLPDVSPATVLESLMISFTPDKKTNPIPLVSEKKLNRNLLSPSSLIDYSVGEKVDVITTLNGKERVESATILSSNGGVLLQYKDRVEAGLPNDARLSFKHIPSSLNTTPVLSVILHNLPKAAATYRADLNYLTSGISWNADYIAKIDDTAKKLRLEGWATLTNSSGMDYKDFKINLVAGEVNLVRQTIPRFKNEMRLMAASALQDASGGNIMPEALGDYHLYAIPNTSTLSDQEQTQIALFTKEAIPFTKSYTFNNESIAQRAAIADRLQNADVALHFKNDEASSLGFPLPEGIIRLYQDNAGNASFLGEDSIPSTPDNQSVSLATGKAFDVTLKRAQTQFTIVNPDEWEVSYALTLNNAKDEAVSVIAKESFYPGYQTNWAFTHQSIPAKIENDTAIWNIEIPAKASEVIEYTVRYTNFKEEADDKINIDK